MGNITKNYYGHSQSHDIEVNVSMSVDEILELQRRNVSEKFAGTEINDAEVKEIKAIPEEFLTKQAKDVFDKLKANGYIDENYIPHGMSQPQMAVLAHQASLAIWNTVRWKPFEEHWELHNMKGSYQTALKQKQTYNLIDNIDKAIR